jgi:hypothetical protein
MHEDSFKNNMVDNIVKIRLDAGGKEIGIYQEPEDMDQDYCGSCYSKNDLEDPLHQELRAEDEKNKKNGICCNTCSSVFAAYASRKQSLPRLDDVAQCVLEKWPEKLKNQSNEGCRVRGRFQVDHSSGDFHFAPGQSYNVNNSGKSVHVHDLRIFDNINFDFSHRIQTLSFGERLPQFDLSEPLRGASYDATDSNFL